MNLSKEFPPDPEGDIHNPSLLIYHTLAQKLLLCRDAMNNDLNGPAASYEATNLVGDFLSRAYEELLVHSNGELMEIDLSGLANQDVVNNLCKQLTGNLTEFPSYGPLSLTLRPLDIKEHPEYIRVPTEYKDKNIRLVIYNPSIDIGENQYSLRTIYFEGEEYFDGPKQISFIGPGLLPR